jgi:hypothetical protein
MTVSPYDPRFTEYSQEKIMLHGKTIATQMTSGNTKLTLQGLITWLSDLNTDGWTNIRVTSHTEPGTEDQLEREYITVRGDRLETDAEFKKRQESIISKWQFDYEQFLLKKNYYENTDLGKAQIAEVEKKSPRRINYPTNRK